MRDLIKSSRVGRGVGSGGATMGIDVDVMAKRELRVNNYVRQKYTEQQKRKYTNERIQRQTNWRTLIGCEKNWTHHYRRGEIINTRAQSTITIEFGRQD